MKPFPCCPAWASADFRTRPSRPRLISSAACRSLLLDATSPDTQGFLRLILRAGGDPRPWRHGKTSLHLTVPVPGRGTCQPLSLLTCLTEMIAERGACACFEGARRGNAWRHQVFNLSSRLRTRKKRGVLSCFWTFAHAVLFGSNTVPHSLSFPTFCLSSRFWARPGFFCFGTIGILGQLLLCGGGCSVHCGKLRSIPGEVLPT